MQLSESVMMRGRGERGEQKSGDKKKSRHSSRLLRLLLMIHTIRLMHLIRCFRLLSTLRCIAGEGFSQFSRESVKSWERNHFGDRKRRLKRDNKKNEEDVKKLEHINIKFKLKISLSWSSRPTFLS